MRSIQKRFIETQRFKQIEFQPDLFDFLKGRQRFLSFFELSPVGILLILAPFSIFPLFQHGTEVHTTRIYPRRLTQLKITLIKVPTGHIKLHVGRIFTMNVRNNDSVLAFIVRLDFTDAQSDRISVTFCKELKSTPFDNFGHAFIKFERWWRFTFNANIEICDLI